MKDEKGHGSNARDAAMARIAANRQNNPNHPLNVLSQHINKQIAAGNGPVVEQPAHQSGVAAATAPMQRRQYEAIAGAINTYPGADKADLAQHFAGALSGTNSKFQADKFRQAAMTGNMGKTKNAAPGMTSSHYEAVASAVHGFGQTHPGSGGAVASHFASELGRRNPNFNADRFMKAAKG